MSTVEHVQLSQYSGQAADWGSVPGKDKNFSLSHARPDRLGGSLLGVRQQGREAGSSP
jgi:hypothetical protein